MWVSLLKSKKTPGSWFNIANFLGLLRVVLYFPSAQLLWV
jgi:hypothetical protein